MSTDTTAPTNPTPEKKGGKKGIFLLLMVLLVALNAFFFYQYQQSNKELEETKAAKMELKAEYDALKTEATVSSLNQVVELFTIALEDAGGKPVLAFSWDQTKVSLPLD